MGGQKFDSARVLALGVMAGGTSSGGDSDGVEVALGVLERTMIGVPVSAETDKLIRRQIADGTGGADRLDVLTALVMGAPEFQVH